MAEVKEVGQRRSRRMRVLKGARIVFNDHRSVINCTVRNFSESGALLLLPSVVAVPNEFELWIDDVCRSARVIRKGYGTIAVAWAESPIATPI